MVKLKILNSTEIHSWGESVPFQSQVFLNTVPYIRSRHGRFRYTRTSIRYIINIRSRPRNYAPINRNFDNNNNNNNFIYIAVYAEAYR